MKKFTLLFLAVIYIFCCTFALTACNDPNTPNDSSNHSQISSQQENPNSNTTSGDTPSSGTQGTNQHVHNYDKWYADETSHWKKCSGEGLCDAKITEQAPHIINAQDNICSVCKKNISVIISETNILIVDGDGKQAEKMQELINEIGYATKIVTPANVPNYVDLPKYNEVILMNVDNKELPTDFDKELDAYVKTYGGGLLTTGGDKTYYYGNMNDTKFDSMLPVNIIPEDNVVNGIMFVIESSGSMYFDYNGASSDCFYDETSAGFKTTPMHYIKSGLTEAAVSIFAKKDYLGVMHFGKNGYKTDLPLTPASQRGSFINAVNGITTIKGTSWSTPLQAAAEHLRDTAYQIDNKQIIFITDSSPMELSGNDRTTDFAKLTKSFEENYGITTSVIAINGCNTVDSTLMNNITTAVDKQGNKRFYNCTTPQELSQAILDECKAASTDIMNEGGNYEVEITSSAENHPVFNGIISDGQKFPLKGVMPNITQYNGVIVKVAKDIEVETLLTADNQENGTHNALYAQWTYGKGHVGSFTSDLGSWAKDYYTDPEAKQFLKNAIKEILLKKTI